MSNYQNDLFSVAIISLNMSSLGFYYSNEIPQIYS